MKNKEANYSSSTVYSSSRVCNGNYGWICPKCERVYSPYTPTCFRCENEETILYGVTGSGGSETMNTQMKYTTNTTK